MIDRAKRDRAAEVVHSFFEGEITNDQFDSLYPPRSDDRAIEAVETMIWNFYDDYRTHKIGREQLGEESVRLFERCIQFLQSDVEYSWPQTNFIRIARPTGVLGLLVGKLWERQDKVFMKSMDEAGNMQAWPFLSIAQMDVATKGRAGND